MNEHSLPITRFWNAYTNCVLSEGGPESACLSEWVVMQTRSLPYMLPALAILYIPLKAPEHDVNIDGCSVTTREWRITWSNRSRKIRHEITAARTPGLCKQCYQPTYDVLGARKVCVLVLYYNRCLSTERMQSLMAHPANMPLNIEFTYGMRGLTTNTLELYAAVG